MLTFLCFISIIHGWSNILQGLARRAVSFSRLWHASAHNSGLRGDTEAHQHEMKYLKPSLHLIPSSGSSFSSGIGCRTM